MAECMCMAVATLATMVARYKPHMLFNMSSRAASAIVDPGSVLWLHQRQERHQQRIDPQPIRYPFVASSNQSNRRSRQNKNHFRSKHHLRCNLCWSATTHHINEAHAVPAPGLA